MFNIVVSNIRVQYTRGTFNRVTMLGMKLSSGLAGDAFDYSEFLVILTGGSTACVISGNSSFPFLYCQTI